jgi:hypothetical protein
MTSSDALLLGGGGGGGGVSGGVTSTSTIGRQQHETYAQKVNSTMHQQSSKKDEDINKEAEASNNDTTDASTASSLYPITDLDTISNILQQAKALEEECKIFTAARLLQNIDRKHFETVHHDIIKEAKLFQCLLDDCAALPDATINSNDDAASSDGEWIKQGETHSNHNFSIYYKVNPTTNHIKCRLETPIHPSLLLSILAVLNETELYKTWIPQYKIPRLQVVKSDKLCQLGRVSQIILVETEVPWPIAKRELILKAVACDDIDHDDDDDNDDDGCKSGSNSSNSNSNSNNKKKSRILVRLQSLDCENNGEDGIEILPASNRIGSGVRIKVDGGFVFEKCPSDHPIAKHGKKDKKKDNKENKKAEGNDNKLSSDEKNEGGNEENNPNDDDDEEDDDNLILLTFTFSVDPKLSILPQSFLNFFLRTAIHQIWGMFLNVATEVCDGKRPEHSAAIARKRVELYDWVEERTRCMLRCGSMMEPK